ncbi:fatty acid--CoA ligase family protein [Sphingosinicella sp. LHD-64]|uniref:ANL family adenylate-forming protein n=1 Tax=Sphingosinicella sp. LHD-64 TaxID=3072139 RepID=UPI00280C9AD2|nr:fatty acid--CoA ligase family protein [Sphingosinicella sp. LHD-64]MDQ8757611.1 fatty acid--CoA ligase family protein [Sphingosinicella sp. LHD-64]
MAFDVSEAVRQRIAQGGDKDAVAFDGRWRSWRWLEAAATAVDHAVGDAAAVGLIARTRPQHVAAFAAGIAAHRTTVMIYAAQSPPKMAEDIRRLRLEAVIADAEDWTPDTRAAANEVGSAAIALEDSADGSAVARLLAPRGDGPLRAATPDIAFELLSSGTTGPPKRVPLRWATFASAVDDAKGVYAGSTAIESPQLMTNPLGNVSGISYLAPPLAYGQRIVLLEKFDPLKWGELVRIHRPYRAGLPPAAIRMVLDAGVPKEDLACLALIGVGGGKVDAEVHERFEDHYGIPVLHAFGATEFAGVVANWTPDAYRQWGKAKRGSAGRASANVALRVVDPETFVPLPPGEIGLLEAQAARIGPDWVRTTDLASIDADGFLFLHGRTDGAINRGGFKIVPETVAEALRAHPAVADAAVVGITDTRLGEVPVAAVELAPGQIVTPDALRDWVRERLVAYQVPTQIRIVPALPRNASLKVSAPDVKALFA